MVGNTALRVLQSHKIPPPSLHGMEGSTLPGFVTADMASSNPVMGITAGDSSVVIGYQVDEISHTCLPEYFVAQSDICTAVRGKL